MTATMSKVSPSADSLIRSDVGVRSEASRRAGRSDSWQEWSRRWMVDERTENGSELYLDGDWSGTIRDGESLKALHHILVGGPNGSAGKLQLRHTKSSPSTFAFMMLHSAPCSSAKRTQWDIILHVICVVPRPVRTLWLLHGQLKRM